MVTSGQPAHSLAVWPHTTAMKDTNWLEMKSEFVNRMDSGTELLPFALVSCSLADLYSIVGKKSKCRGFESHSR